MDMENTHLHAINIFNRYARQYQDRYMEEEIYHESFDLFCELIPEPKAQILEIGCGPGNCTRYLLRRRPDMDILAIDGAAEMIALAKRNNPKARFERMDARDIKTLSNAYHGIFCGFCLPYLNKTETVLFIEDASGLLRANGVLYISTMEGPASESGYVSSSTNNSEKLFTNYHEADYLLEALKANGFTDIRLKRIIETSEEKTVTNLVIVAKC